MPRKNIFYIFIIADSHESDHFFSDKVLRILSVKIYTLPSFILKWLLVWSMNNFLKEIFVLLILRLTSKWAVC